MAVRADLTLIVVVVIWGATFVSVQNAIDEIPVHSFHVLRFGIATIALLPLLLFRRRRKESIGSPALLWKAGFLAGLSLWLGYSFQTTGLLHTTPSHSGFLTGMAVVIVPLLAWWLLGQKLEKRVVLGVSIAAAGLALLTLGGSSTIERPPTEPDAGYGNLLTFGCAVAFAFQIIVKARWAAQLSALSLTLVELFTVFLLSLAAALVLEEIPDPRALSDQVWGAVLLTGLLATAFAFLAQSWAQSTTTAIRTAVIFAFEPVTAATFSWLLIGEVLSGWAVLGGMLIIAGMLRTEIGDRERS
ncbi:MAG: DMT family transporter [Planctomycetota bacterium]|nr:DMT family transporter [Planctomycetota bacterium]